MKIRAWFLLCLLAALLLSGCGKKNPDPEEVQDAAPYAGDGELGAGVTAQRKSGGVQLALPAAGKGLVWEAEADESLLTAESGSGGKFLLTAATDEYFTTDVTFTLRGKDDPNDLRSVVTVTVWTDGEHALMAGLAAETKLAEGLHSEKKDPFAFTCCAREDGTVLLTLACSDVEEPAWEITCSDGLYVENGDEQGFVLRAWELGDYTFEVREASLDAVLRVELTMRDQLSNLDEGELSGAAMSLIPVSAVFE